MMAETGSDKASPGSARGTPTKEKRRNVLEARLRKATAGMDSGTRQTIQPADSSDPPLSSAQQQLWILDRFGVEPSVYTIAVAYDLAGQLDLDRLQSAVNAFAARHDVLCSRITQGAEAPIQLVGPTREIPVLFASKQEDGAIRTEDWVAAFCNQGFDIEQGPVCAAGVLRTGKDEHIFCFAAHHAFFDGSSLAILETELSQLYAEQDDSVGDALAPLQVQYGDFCHWEQQQIESGKFKGQLEFWLEQLKGQLPLLELSEDKPRPAEQDFAGATIHRELPADLIQKVDQFAAQRRATPYMVLMACYLTVLHRHTGQCEFIVGVPVSARTLPELEGLVGMMVNTLPLRVAIEPAWDFDTLLAEVKQQNLAALENRDLPFDHLVAELNPARDLSRTPVFQTIFGLREQGDSSLALGGLQCRRYPVPAANSRTDLSLWMVHGADRVSVEVEYATAIFEQSSIERFVGHFERVLRVLVSVPDQKLNQVALMSPAEIQEVTVDGNQTEVSYPRVDLYAMFHAQVISNPNAVAVRCGRAALTYLELDRAAAHFADRLREYAPVNGFVGVSLRRNEYLPVVLLGILRAGFAYLPLDPSFPEQRLQFMLEDSNANLLVTQSELMGQFDQFTGSVLLLDEMLESLGECKASGEAGLAHELAYMTYTSGSTGKPKGVMVGQAEVVNFLHTMAERPGIKASDTLLAVTTLSFDISVLELFLPLTSGACVDIVTSESSADGSRLLAALNESQATIMQATPATWRMLFEAGWKGDKDLTILCGGEALPPDLATSLLEAGKTVWNMYGPTETTVWSACHQLDAGDNRVVIGKPIGNTRLYVLDSWGQPVPVGVPGELYIAGAGVTRGYFGRPELTSERYLPDRFVDDASERMYRTGDIVRLLADGNLEYRHRADNQVKIRGFRIELGEIEATLLNFPEILQCAVAVEEPAPGDQRLVAYLVNDSGQMPSSVALRKMLVQSLPAYMLPQHYIMLCELPRTPNGKIDRNALPGLGAADQLSGREFEPPETPAEKHLATVWERVLGAERVGRNDNFFELGGHSLLTLKVLSQLDPSFGFDFAPQSFLLENLQQLASTVQPAETQGIAETMGQAEQDASLLGRLKSQLFLKRSS